MFVFPHTHSLVSRLPLWTPKSSFTESDGSFDDTALPLTDETRSVQLRQPKSHSGVLLELCGLRSWLWASKTSILWWANRAGWWGDSLKFMKGCITVLHNVFEPILEQSLQCAAAVVPRMKLSLRKYWPKHQIFLCDAHLCGWTLVPAKFCQWTPPKQREVHHLPFLLASLLIRVYRNT